MDKSRQDTNTDNPRCLVVTLGRPHQHPWWWENVSANCPEIRIDYARLNFRDKLSQEISVLETPLFMLSILRQLLRWRREYEYVFTFECDLVGLSISFWQAFLPIRKPRHVILHFIMREKQETVASKMKYWLLTKLFRTIHRAIVSANHEVRYYSEVFNWPVGKAAFVPLFTDPELLAEQPEVRNAEPYGIAAGRTFRDYDTLVSALAGTSNRMIIVGGSGTAAKYSDCPNIESLENVPPDELNRLIADADYVVVPLMEREISTGQSVILQSMALGKPVVATEVPGTVDYVSHMETGLLVPVADHVAMAEALNVMQDKAQSGKLATAAKAQIENNHQPYHYARKVKRLI